MILRMRPLAPPVRSTNQQLSALSGWKRNQRHANCNSIRRTRGLPQVVQAYVTQSGRGTWLFPPNENGNG